MSGRARLWVVLLQLLAMIAVSGVAIVVQLSREAEVALNSSDQAFDKGELKGSLVEAYRASLLSVSGSSIQRRASERIEAIAVGSEATGRPRTALLAWSSLCAVAAATWNTISTDTRLGQQIEQHMAYSLDKATGVRARGSARSELFAVASLRTEKRWVGRGALPVVAGFLLGILGIMVPIRNSRAWFGARASGVLLVGGLYFAAVTSWCIGWMLA